MSNKDSFERFFQDRLMEGSVPQEDWNTPSELPWENAKIFFPKKKKRRRGFIIFYSMLVIGLLGAGVYWSPNINDYINSERQTAQDIYPQPAENTEIKTIQEYRTSQQIQQEQLEESSLSATARSKDDIANVIKDASGAISKTTDAVRRESADQLGSQSPTLHSSQAQANIMPVGANVGSPIAIKANKSQVLDNGLSKGTAGGEQNPAIISQSDQQQSASSTQNQGDLLLEEGMVPYISEDEESINGTEGSIDNQLIEEAGGKLRYGQGIDHLASLAFSAFAITNAQPTIEPTKLITVTQPEVDAYRWSTGLSTFRLLANPFSSDELLNPNELSTSYANINFWLSKRLNKKWSISSGFRYTKFNIDYSISFEDAFDINDPEASISRSLEEEADVINFGNARRVIELMFKDDAGLMNGDLLRLEAELPIDLAIYSFPIFFTYQLNSPKFNYFLRGGLTFDFYNIEVTHFDVAVFNANGRIVSEPLVFEAVDEYEYGGALLMGAGVQYNITNRFYAETGIMFDVADPKFSMIDVGLHFRF